MVSLDQDRARRRRVSTPFGDLPPPQQDSRRRDSSRQTHWQLTGPSTGESPVSPSGTATTMRAVALEKCIHKAESPRLAACGLPSIAKGHTRQGVNARILPPLLETQPPPARDAAPLSRLAPGTGPGLFAAVGGRGEPRHPRLRRWRLFRTPPLRRR